MSIRLTDALRSGATNNKLADAEQIFLKGDTQNVESEINGINSRHDTLSKLHESLSTTVQKISATGKANTATEVTYNNTNSGIVAENIQDAVDKLAAKDATKAEKADVASQMQTEQSRVNTELAKKFNLANITQDSGESEDKVMSQKAVSTKLSDLSKKALTTGAEYLFKSDSRIFEITMTNLIQGNCIKVESETNVGIFLFYSETEYESFQANTLHKIKNDNIFKLRIYNNDANEGFSAKVLVTSNIIADMQSDLVQAKSDLKQAKSDIKEALTTGAEYLFKSDSRIFEITMTNLIQGNCIKVESETNVGIFLFYSETEYESFQANTLHKIKNDNIFKLRIYNNDANEGFSAKVLVTSNIIADMQSDLVQAKSDLDKQNINANILILGDSYSQNGGNWVGSMMKEFKEGSKYISLAVSSATIRDKYSDRATYPYTSRPSSSDNTGNKNTLACQIEKLKRLMNGTDLDKGEEQLYKTVSEYPNIIIIEGGMNDKFDSDSKEQEYIHQFEIKKENVYIAQKKSSQPTLGSVYIKPSLDDIDRTCFAGAYRYLVEQLLTLFPNAQVFFTTCSNLGYYNNSVIETRYKVRAQQIKCAELCSASIINWGLDGQISNIVNYPSGSGTKENPYIWGQLQGNNTDTDDLMHPNKRGGKKYGKLAALIIKQRFLGEL